jgi:Tol biopolymer transport system component
MVMTLVMIAWGRTPFDKSRCQRANRQANIDPDYSDTVIPPNIAPLNFVVKEPGVQFYIELSCSEGETIRIHSKKAGITIPIKPWKKLLQSNLGQEIHFDVYVKKQKGQWIRFDSIVNRIAKEEIDPYLVYRLIQPMYYYFSKMGIYQRNLENFEEKPVFLNRSTSKSCMNCHTFCNNDPEKMMFHIRGAGAGMILIHSDRMIKVNTKTEFNPSAAVYPVWHPNGKVLAFSINRLRQFFHAVGESREVIDQVSDLILYCIDSNTITTHPSISDPEKLETYPEWSPDGKHLYFCSTPKYQSINDYREIRYDLVRIAYDQNTGTWGELETLLSASRTGLSMLMPRISPDGQHLLFCGADHGNFPVYLESSDLYLMDLKTRKFRRLERVNSDYSESYHSWSSNGRWFVFCSKRRDHLCARPYFSYVDEKGKVYKPFLAPQKDPNHYGTFLKTYNLPELIKTAIQNRPQEILRVASNNRNIVDAILDPNVTIPQSPADESTAGQMAPQ